MPPSSKSVANGFRRSANRVRDWFGTRLDDQAADIAKLYASSRDRFVYRIGQTYQAHLDEDPSILRARHGPAGALIDAAISDTTTALADELGHAAIRHLSDTLDATPQELRDTYGRWADLEFRDLPESSQRVLGELTTSVIGGGTYFDRLFHVTDGLRHDIVTTIRGGLLNGADFETTRAGLMKAFGVDKLSNPTGPAYGSVLLYTNEARRQWNGLMQDIADDQAEQGEDGGGVTVWYAVLEGSESESTTPGCAARHGWDIEQLGESPPRHINCRCTVMLVDKDTDLAMFRAMGDAWLEEHGYGRNEAMVSEARRRRRWPGVSFVEAYNPEQPRVPAGNPEGGQWGAGGSGGGGGSGDAPAPSGGDSGSKADAPGTYGVEAKIAASLAEFENAHASDPIESARAVARDGSVMMDKSSGRENAVEFSKEEMEKLRGQGVTFTHNHPHGNSFSFDDIDHAHKIEAKEIRAVTKDAVFRMRPGSEGWFPTQVGLKMAFAKYDTQVHDEFVGKIAAGTMTIPEANAAHYNEVWRRIAAANPEHLVYSREARNARNTERRLEDGREPEGRLREDADRALEAGEGAPARQVVEAYNPEQPRVPAGNPAGGQWGSGGGGGTAVMDAPGGAPGGGGGSGPAPIEFVHPSAETFIAARNESSRPGFLSPLAPADLADRTLYISKDGTVGFALDPHGDLENLFNNGGPKGAAREAIFSALDHGAKTLDCFDGYLPQLYSQFGFVETERMKFNREYAPPGWDYQAHDDPDVVFMAHEGLPGTKAEVRATLQGDKRDWHVNRASTRYVDDWDTGKADSRAAAATRSRHAESGRRVGGEARRSDPRPSPRPRGVVEADRPPIWGAWGGSRLVPLFHVLVESAFSPGYRYQARAYTALPTLTARGDDWSRSIRAAVRTGEPGDVLARVWPGGRDVEVFAESGWVPVRPRRPTGGRWIEAAGGQALDSRSGAHWQPRSVRLPLDLLARWPAMRSVSLPAAKSYTVALVDEAEAEALAAGLHSHEGEQTRDLGAFLAQKNPSPAYAYLSLGTPKLATVVSLKTGDVLYARDPFPPGLVAPYQRAAMAVWEPDGQVWAIRPRGKSFWALPGGHLDPGESPGAAAEREAHEEAGLRVGNVKFMGRLYRPWSTTSVFTADRVGEPELPSTLDEIDGALPVDLDDLDPTEAAFLLRHDRRPVTQ